MAQETQAQTMNLDETLNKTDFGHFVNTNKKPIIVGFIIALILVVIVSVVKVQKDKAQAQTLNNVFSVSESIVGAYIKGDLKADEYLTKFKTINDSVLKSSAFTPSLLEANAKLITDGKVVEASEQLETVLTKIGKSELAYFLQIRLAPLYENQGANDKALKLYEKLAQSGKDLLAGKIYLDLARLYAKTGDNDKAKKNFEFVIKNHADTEYAKLAKLYLIELK